MTAHTYASCLSILLDSYQRSAVHTLRQAQAAHDQAFRMTSTLEELVGSHASAGQAFLQSHAALTALQAMACFSPAEMAVEPGSALPAGSMAFPVVAPN